MDGFGVAAHARLRPDKVAMVHGERRITYAEPDERAARAAAIPEGHGVGPQARHGIALSHLPGGVVGAPGAAPPGARGVTMPAGPTQGRTKARPTDGREGFPPRAG